MSRAINLTAQIDTVKALCAKHSVIISSIEPLPAGGTRLVLQNSDGADTIRHLMKSQIAKGPVVRSGLFLSRLPISYDR